MQNTLIHNLKCDKCEERYDAKITEEKIKDFYTVYFSCPYCGQRYYIRIEKEEAIKSRRMLSIENKRYKKMLENKKEYTEKEIQSKLNKVLKYKKMYSKQCDIARDEFFRCFPQYRF